MKIRALFSNFVRPRAPALYSILLLLLLPSSAGPSSAPDVRFCSPNPQSRGSAKVLLAPVPNGTIGPKASAVHSPLQPGMRRGHAARSVGPWRPPWPCLRPADPALGPGFCWVLGELLPPGHWLPRDPLPPPLIFTRMCLQLHRMPSRRWPPQPGRVSGGAARGWRSARCLL